MDFSSLQLANIEWILNERENIAQILEEDMTPREAVNRFTQLLPEDVQMQRTAYLLSLIMLYAPDSGTGFVEETIADSELLTEDQKKQLRDLRQRVGQRMTTLWEEGLGAILVGGFQGYNRWGNRDVGRRIDMESKLPLMQVQVQDAERPDHDVFVTEESTMGFTQNILGLLYSLATTYEAFSEDGQELPKFYALDEKDHLVEMLRQIRKMAVALDADFDDLVEMSMEN